MAEREEWIRSKKKNFENSLGSIISEIVKPHFKGKNKVETVFLTSFNNIFPAEITSKVKYIKVMSSKGGRTTLYLEVSAKYMLEVTHLKDIMLDKISLYFGYKAVDDIVFKRK